MLSFAHLPVAIYLMLGPQGAGPLDTPRLQQLTEYHARLQRVEKKIDQIGLCGADLERQKQILGASKQFLEQAIQQQ